MSKKTTFDVSNITVSHTADKIHISRFSNNIYITHWDFKMILETILEIDPTYLDSVKPELNLEQRVSDLEEKFKTLEQKPTQTNTCYKHE